VKLTAAHLQVALLKEYRDNTLIACPNTWYGISESDFLVVTKARLVTEFEIKLATDDFRQEFKEPKAGGSNDKWRKHDHMRRRLAHSEHFPAKIATANRYYFVAPMGVIPPADVPEYAGLLLALVSERGKIDLVVQREALLLHREKATEKAIRAFGRGMMFRWHDLKERELKRQTAA
jgi:hypothetical protein